MATPKLMTYKQVYTPNQSGHIDLTGVVDIKDFSNVDFQIATATTVSPNVLVYVNMGKLSGAGGWTLAVQVDHYPLKDWRQIRSYKVMAPEFSISIDNVFPASIGIGIDIEAWVFLH
jgi:hypothetical protein